MVILKSCFRLEFFARFGTYRKPKRAMQSSNGNSHQNPQRATKGIDFILKAWRN